MDVYLLGLHLMGVHLIVHLVGVYLMGMYLMDVHLMNMYLMGVCPMGLSYVLRDLLKAPSGCYSGPRLQLELKKISCLSTEGS
jgi:hypothetical protein